MNRKNIAIVMGPIYLGGAERALVNFLNFFDYERYRVELWVCGEEQGNVGLINKNVTVKYVQSEFALPQQKNANDNPFAAVKRILARLMAKRHISHDAKNKHYYTQSLPKLSDVKYDCVICYRGWDDAVLRLAFNRLRAKKRIVWMHNDTYDTAFPFPLYYQKADKIYCVSRTIKDHMLEKYRGLDADKLDVFYNILDEADILKKAEQPCDVEMTHPAILSVGRLSWEKGFEMIPKIAWHLKQKGHDFKWYIVGEGYKRRDIEPEIEAYSVQDSVFLLGAKDNPYPYFKNCDIFVQTSLTEGYCITTAEAKLLHKPVVTTNLPVMYEQFTHRENGLIAEEITPASLAETIDALLSDSALCERISEQLKKEKPKSTDDYQRLYDFMEK